jgi:small-conductance mechanosensitive channel
MVVSIHELIENPILILGMISTVVGAFLIVEIFNTLIGRIEKRGDLEKGKLVHMRRFFQIIIYTSAGFIILSILDVDITAMVAGLGVGALVIGFGLKDIIENWKTYDRNEIIIPNSVLMREKVINLTSGNKEAVASITFAIDYMADAEKAKSIIEDILKDHKAVIFNLKRKREIRFILRSQEWTNQLETLFWINDPSNEEFIKSNIRELILTEFKKNRILPPIPAIIRKEYLPGQSTADERQSE